MFRQSAWPALFVTVGVLAAATGVATAGVMEALPRWIAYSSAAMLLLFASVTAAMSRKALGSENWIVRINTERVLIKLRSYLNTDLSADAPHVLELPHNEILAAGFTRLDLTSVDSSGAPQSEAMQYLDLHLVPDVDLALLDECLRRERTSRSGATTWRHYPVTRPGERIVRIEWQSRHSRVRPQVESALRLIGKPAEPVEESVNLARLATTREGADLERQARRLADQGRVIDATLLLERALGCSTTEARRIVERLAVKEIPGDG